MLQEGESEKISGVHVLPAPYFPRLCVVPILFSKQIEVCVTKYGYRAGKNAS